MPKDRDPIINAQPSSKQSAPRGDLLNGSPKTKSIAGGSANFSPHKTSDLKGAPPPNNPYK